MQRSMTPVFRILLACLCLIGALAAVFPVQAALPPNGPNDPAELEAFLDGVIGVQMEENDVPGTVVMVVKDGEVFLAKGYGYADLETHTPVDPERTLFRPGSISKLFVWTAVMQLAEQGKIDLDTDVNTYLDFTIPDTFPEPITFKHLLTHTPGFEEINQDISVLRAEAMYPLGECLKTSIPARIFAPGEVIAYSNYGAALAAYIVERVSGLSFDTYVEQHIFAPLEMQHSTFRQPLPENLAADMASGYNFSGGVYQKGNFEFVLAYPAGSLSATASDMAHFMIAHLQNGRYGEQRILQETTAIQMHQPLFARDPRLDGMAYGFFENTINGQRVISHAGDTFLFHSELFLLPEQNMGIFVSTNGANGDSIASTVRDTFLNRYYPVHDAKDPQPPADFAERISPYLGEYMTARSNFTSIEKAFALLSPALTASVSEDDYLSLTGDQLLVELEPGLLQLRGEPRYRLVYQTGANGQQYLLTDPLASSAEDYIKVPWYGSVSLHQALLLVLLAFFVTALVRWSYGFFKNLRKGEPQSSLARLAHWNAGLFGLLLVMLIVCFLAVVMDTVPVYEEPRFLFADEATPLLSLVLFLPWPLALTGLAIPVFTLLVWAKKLWSLSGRIFYTLLTLCALAGVWMLFYWNFLKL